MTGCRKQGKSDRSLNGVMKQSVANAVAVPSNHHLTNGPVLFVASIDGTMSGNHWDAQGRRYVPQLQLLCRGRESEVLLRFAATVASSTPLPARNDLRAVIALDRKSVV